MCLSRVITKNRDRFPEEVTGYKVFRVLYKKLTSQYTHNTERVSYRRRRWYRDIVDRMMCITGPGRVSYERGYHMYTNKKDAIREANECHTNMVVAKVRLQKIHTYGRQYCNIGHVYVGKKMMITEIIHTNKKK